MSFQTAFQQDAFQNDAFQIYSSVEGQALVSIIEIVTINARVSISEIVPVYANMGVVVPGSSSPSVNANVGVWEE